MMMIYVYVQQLISLSIVCFCALIGNITDEYKNLKFFVKNSDFWLVDGVKRKEKVNWTSRFYIEETIENN